MRGDKSWRCARGSSRCTRQRIVSPLWSLPDELILQIMRSLHIKDLLNFSLANSYMQDLVSISPSLWSSVSFQDTWPSQHNLRHFEKAAKYGNVEAIMKLGIAYLYNEGLPGDKEGKKIVSNGEKAANMFCAVESLTPHTAPFCWLFIRPPWATGGACCKECVFNNMITYDKQHCDPSVEVCIARTLQLLDEESSVPEMEKYLQKAADQNSPVASYLLWQHKQKSQVLSVSDLHCVRELRSVASLGYVDAQLKLCHYYSRGRYGGISHAQAFAHLRMFVEASQPTHIENVYKYQQLTHSMRYILLDWLVEVANMKDFSSLTLHVAIDMVDRYIKARHTTRSTLQLLGVAAMVLCSRFLGKDIITIREAAWLTDNTYKYEDVVRMMGEITATLKGKFRSLTSLDYTELLGSVADNDQQTQHLAEYVCELALLQSEMGRYQQAVIGACAVLLARLALKKDQPWPQNLQECTGFTMTEIAPYVSHLHHKCFVEQTLTDHRNVELQSVKTRYSEPDLLQVSSLKMLKKVELNYVLGLDSKPVIPCDLCLPSRATSPNNRDLIMSPSRKHNTSSTNHSTRGKTPYDSATLPESLSKEREKAATPTLDHSFSELQQRHNESVGGYDADKEDGEESYLDISCGSDPDLESLWCGDHTAAADREGNESTAGYQADCGLDTTDTSFLAPPTPAGGTAAGEEASGWDSVLMTGPGDPESFSFLHSSAAAAGNSVSHPAMPPSASSSPIKPAWPAADGNTPAAGRRGRRARRKGVQRSASRSRSASRNKTAGSSKAAPGSKYPARQRTSSSAVRLHSGGQPVSSSCTTKTAAPLPPSSSYNASSFISPLPGSMVPVYQLHSTPTITGSLLTPTSSSRTPSLLCLNGVSPLQAGSTVLHLSSIMVPGQSGVFIVGGGTSDASLLTQSANASSLGRSAHGGGCSPAGPGSEYTGSPGMDSGIDLPMSAHKPAPGLTKVKLMPKSSPSLSAAKRIVDCFNENDGRRQHHPSQHSYVPSATISKPCSPSKVDSSQLAEQPLDYSKSGTAKLRPSSGGLRERNLNIPQSNNIAGSMVKGISELDSPGRKRKSSLCIGNDNKTRITSERRPRL